MAINLEFSEVIVGESMTFRAIGLEDDIGNVVAIQHLPTLNVIYREDITSSTSQWVTAGYLTNVRLAIFDSYPFTSATLLKYRTIAVPDEGTGGGGIAASLRFRPPSPQLPLWRLLGFNWG
jgi:hypothetical protein